MRKRTLYLAGAALGAGAVGALILSRRSRVRLLPGEPDWSLGKPLQTVIVTEGWGMPRVGRLHGSVDLRAPVGTPFFAVGAGRVLFAGTYTDGNTAIEVDHGDGMVVRYLHHSRALVKRGDVVARGQQIGLTGFAKSPHLHLDVSVLPSQVAMYQARFGSPRGIGEQTAILAGSRHVKVPAEPLIPIDGAQADVVAMAQSFGVALPQTTVVA
jgi:murein DD-endopeptidase MepM/ murein hydrolase activator NlpD